MTRRFEYGLADLCVTRAAVVAECGGVGDELAGTLHETIDELLAVVPAEPRGGFVFSDHPFAPEPFDPGPIVAEQLAGAERYAVFLATLGPAFDAWSRAFFAEGDAFRGFVANAIGNVAVEAVVDRVEAEIGVSVEEAGVSNRLSPGYCGWSVTDQHRLFSVFPADFLGVRLTDAALMVPLKSVSGVIGIGPGLVKRPYPCDVCEIENCPTGGSLR